MGHIYFDAIIIINTFFYLGGSGRDKTKNKHWMSEFEQFWNLYKHRTVTKIEIISINIEYGRPYNTQ